MNNNSKYNESFDNKTLSDLIKFDNILEIDPSSKDGYQFLSEIEVPIELRIIDDPENEKEMGTLESLKVKILYKGNNEEPEKFKIELTSELDLFFHFDCVLDNILCEEIIDNQNLNLNYQGFYKLINKLFKNILNNPNIFYGIFKIFENGEGKLEFIQNLEYKFVDLLNLKFIKISEENIKDHISFRYNIIKAKMLFFQNKLKDFSNMVKIKNPSLLVNFKKSNLNQTYSSIKTNKTNKEFN